jgi:hypothetical protein
MKYLFPCAIVGMFVGAGIVSMAKGDMNAAIYSFSGAALNFVVYFRPFP